MNSLPSLTFSRHANAFGPDLSLETVRQQAPAVFAASAAGRMSPRYAFIASERVLSGLMQAGFVPVEARQAHTRSASPLHARHMLRLRRRLETISAGGSMPELVFLNSHDGSTRYTLRMGIHRVVCTNGLIVSKGAFPAVSVAHRGDVVDQVVAGAVGMAEQFDSLAAEVERMEKRVMFKDEQLQFAERALALRYPDPAMAGMPAASLLACRRTEDMGDNLWVVTNRVQENLVAGGLVRRSVTGRWIRTRRLSSIKEDVRINSALWDLARGVLAA